ncbi:MAG TPA: type II/IV secretion system protein [Verrucomicrobiales bacterium]|nr:type II/IV secretion system protein [Verrucomicrobiales bacterium]HIL69958.1 type II/IV secretion system protein [Verrucomicrobiota bacterium]
MGIRSQDSDIGNLFLNSRVVTEKQLELARRRCRRLQIPLHQSVVDLGYASESVAYKTLAENLRLDYIDLSETKIDEKILRSIPVKQILHYRFIPVHSDDKQITVAFADPPSLSEQGNLRLLLGKRLKINVTTPGNIHSAIKTFYGLGVETIQQLSTNIVEVDVHREIVFDVSAPLHAAPSDASISDFVNQILMEALRLQATDVHIEPFASKTHLRYRIDGTLQDVPVPSDLKDLHKSLVSRIKVMSRLDLAEKRVPQDGRMTMKTGDQEYDLRLSIMPTVHGESVCIRILGRQSLYRDISSLGMDPDQQNVLEDLTHLNQGLILVNGPTGSGKTTTLYGAIAFANDETRKIITLEDPVEYQLEGIAQMSIKRELGFTFSSGLRSILRHDPDVILIGEIRDTETAEIALRSSQTGHLVFSTLHANDSISAIIRLIDMKIEPFLIGNALVASIAQRLAARICRQCCHPVSEIPESVVKEMSKALGIPKNQVQTFEGEGCVECMNKGHRGRVAIYEFLLMNDELSDLLSPGIKTGKLKAFAANYGWKPLRDRGWRKVQNGMVSHVELDRLTRRINTGGLIQPDLL